MSFFFMRFFGLLLGGDGREGILSVGSMRGFLVVCLESRGREEFVFGISFLRG